MNRALAAVALVLATAVGGGIGATAQTPPATPAGEPFQVITVAGYRYRVDPYFPCVAYITERTTKLDPEHGPVTSIVMLIFTRDAAGAMVPGTPFATAESELTAKAEVGQAWTCGPQEAAAAEDGDD